MAKDPVRGVRLPGSLIDEVRAARPELANAELSRLVRTGLALLANYPLPEALERSQPSKRSRPLEREHAEAAV